MSPARRASRARPRGTGGSHAGPPRSEIHAFGRRAAHEAIVAGSARRVLVDPSGPSADLAEEARAHGVAVEAAEPERLHALAAGLRHQGVAVELRPPAALGERDLGERDWPADALVVILDGVLDPQNVGAAARAAEAAGASALVLRERRAAGVTPAAIRASAGALLHLPVAVVANLPRAIERLKDHGFVVAGLDGTAEAGIYDDDPPEGPLALVVGSEERGLSRLVREACDVVLSLPMRGKVGSLNAATAVSAALYGYALRPRSRTGTDEPVTRAHKAGLTDPDLSD